MKEKSKNGKVDKNWTLNGKWLENNYPIPDLALAFSEENFVLKLVFYLYLDGNYESLDS